MSLTAARLICNIQDASKIGLLQSFQSQQPATAGLYFRGDVNRIEFYPVAPADSGSGIFWQPVSIDPANLKFGIGDADEAPTSGTFSLSYNGITTGLTSLSIATITASQLQTAINAASIGDTVVVSELAKGIFQVAFDTAGVRYLFAGDATNLQPESNIFVSRIQIGSVSKREIQIIQILARPYVYVTDWTATDSASVSFSTLRVGGASAKAMYAVSVSPTPYAGTFTIGDSGAMSYNGTQTEWQTAMGTGWTVVKTGVASLTIEKSNVGMDSLSSTDVNVDNLSVYEGLIGTLSFNAGTLFKRFMEESGVSFSTTLQIRSDDGTNVDTLFSGPVTLYKDILSSGALAPSNWEGAFYTKTEVQSLLNGLMTHQAISVSSAGTTTMTKPGPYNRVQTVYLTAGSGSGAYTRKAVLATTDAIAGDVVRFNISFPASVNPTIEIRNATDSGTVLDTWTGTGSAFTRVVECEFDGTAWQLFQTA